MNIEKIQASALKMQDDVEVAETDMASFATSGKSKDGSVLIELDGYHHVTGIFVKEDEWNGDKSKLCGSLIEAFNNAVDQVDNEVERKMSALVYKYTAEAIEGKQKGEF